MYRIRSAHIKAVPTYARARTQKWCDTGHRPPPRTAPRRSRARQANADSTVSSLTPHRRLGRLFAAPASSAPPRLHDPVSSRSGNYASTNLDSSLTQTDEPQHALRRHAARANAEHLTRDRRQRRHRDHKDETPGPDAPRDPLAKIKQAPIPALYPRCTSVAGQSQPKPRGAPPLRAIRKRLRSDSAPALLARRHSPGKRGRRHCHGPASR
jgi:hypothetical protein